MVCCFSGGQLVIMKRLFDFSSEGLERMFAHRDQDIQRLEQEVQRLQRRLQEVQERTSNHIALLQEQLANKTEETERLQAMLRSQQDYEKIKTELRTLRAQTDLHVVSVSSSPSDVRCVSVENDAVIEVKVKTPVFHHSCVQEEPLDESFSITSGLPVENSRSPSSSVRSLQTVIKAELDADGARVVESEGFLEDDEHELDTLRLTQQVKEALQRRNIGQRVFGHYVMGLSQGSVSDILARPKPWSKLTSRGREPFLRMKHFLSDEHSIQTLSSIQERLRGLAPCVRSADVSSDQAIRYILDQSRLEMLDEELRSVHSSSGGSENTIRTILQEAQQQMQTNHTQIQLEHTLEPGVQTTADFVQGIIQKVKYEIDEDAQPSVPQMFQTLPDRHRWSFEDRTVDERLQSSPTATTSGLDLQSLELDTFSITQRVKETLIVHNIGQRVFGEEVLGLTQSTVSELLSHPKPWTKLSLKGKENFIRMHLWLQDPHSIQKLNARRKSDQRARLKRDLRMFDAQEWSDLGRLEAMKRPRVVLSVQEKEALRSAYELEPYPSTHTIDRLAAQLGLMTSTVSNWFYNYRSRIRRDGVCESVQVRGVPNGLLSVTVKQEPEDPKAEDPHVSVGVQSIRSLKQEKEEDLESFCSSF